MAYTYENEEPAIRQLFKPCSRLLVRVHKSSPTRYTNQTRSLKNNVLGIGGSIGRAYAYLLYSFLVGAHLPSADTAVASPSSLQRGFPKSQLSRPRSAFLVVFLLLVVATHRPQSSSLLGFIFRILQGNPKRNYFGSSGQGVTVRRVPGFRI